MMNWKILGVAACSALCAPAFAVGKTKAAATKQDVGSLANISADDIDGKPVKLSQFSGKTLLIVNTASECGFTPQYKGLEELYQKYQARGFVVLGFPSNDFGAQEPGSNAEIKKFCELRYKTSFPMFAKVTTKGSNKHPLYSYLSETQPNKETRKEPQWNFTKYLVSPEGNVVGYYPSKVEPMSEALSRDIEKVLPKKQ